MRQAQARTYGRGQSTLEFVWLVVAILVIIVGLQTVLRRAVGGRYRGSIDQVSQQHFNPHEPYAYNVRSAGKRTDVTEPTGTSKSVVGTLDPTTNDFTGDEVSTQSIKLGGSTSTELVVEQTGTLAAPTHN